MLTAMQRAILLTLLDAKQRSGSAMLEVERLAAALGSPRHTVEGECEALAQGHLATCSPIPGPFEIISLTVNGVRAAQRLLEHA